MTIFYICRHGETENNKNQLLSGWIDTPLTDEGKQDAISSSQKLSGIQFDKIISSDLGRAFTTASIIAKEIDYPTTIECSANLREVNYGDLSNLPYTGDSSLYPKLSPQENTNFIPPNGESLLQMQQRVITYINELGDTNPGKTILLTAHDGTINAVYASFTDQDIGIVDADNRNPHDFVAKFELDGARITSFEEIGT